MKNKLHVFDFDDIVKEPHSPGAKGGFMVTCC